MGWAHADPAPLLGPDGATWFGPLPPAPPGEQPDERGVLVVDPSSGEPWIEVTELALEGVPETLSLTRRWHQDRWRWVGEAWLTRESEVIRVADLEGSLSPFPPFWTDPTDPLCHTGTELDNEQGDRLVCQDDGYELTRADGTRERFDHAGHLLRRDEPGGQTLLWSWTEDGLASLEHPDGRRLELGQTMVVGARREREARDPSGRTARYELGEEDRLVSVTAPSGLRHRYLYDAQGRLETILWSDGSRAVLSRDGQGKVLGIEGPGRARWRFEWGEDGLTRAFDGRGSAWRIHREDGRVRVQDPSGRSASLLFENGRISGWEDPAGHRTRLDRNPQGVLESAVAPSGARWGFRWDEQLRLAAIEGPLGAPWRLERDDRYGSLRIIDPTGRTQRYRHDARGRVVELDDGATRIALRRDEAGRLEEIVHGTRGSTLIERDAAGRITSITDAAGGRTVLGDPVGSVPARITDPNGGSWQLRFDRLGRIRSLTDPENTETSWQRSPAGGITLIERSGFQTRLDRRSDGAVTRMIDPLGRITGWARDGMGRVSAWLRPDGSELRISRDPRGDIQRLGLGDRHYAIERDLLGRPVAIQDQQNEDRAIRWLRDFAGLVREIVWPGGGLRIERDAAGLVREVELGERRWALDRDTAGRTIGVREGERRWSIGRDGSGLTSTLSSEDLDLSIARDPRGLARQSEVFGLQLQWRRDTAGRTARLDGPGGASLGVQRDGLGRPVLLRLPGGSLLRLEHDSERLALRLEDERGRQVYGAEASKDALGRLDTVRDDAGIHRHRYGPSDELLSVEGEQDAWSIFPGRHEGPPGTLVVTTDLDLRPTHAEIELAVPVWGVARRQLDYRLDDAGELVGIQADAGEVRLEHDPLGRLVALAIHEEPEAPALVSWSIQWDPFGRPEAILSNGERTRFAFLDGSLLAIEERGRTAVALQEDGVTVLAGDDGFASMIRGLGGYRELALFSRGEPYRAASTPGGLRDLGYPSTSVDGGRIQLFPGGPSLGPTDARDPLSGLPTSLRGALFPSGAVGWPLPNERTLWPALDGASAPPWDPEPWAGAGPWSDTLGLLMELGELDSPLSERWWLATPAPAPLPWMPASLEGRPPAPLPAPGSLPLREDPIPTMLLIAAMPPTTPLQGQALLEQILAAELEELPDGWPGIQPPAKLPGIE
jgi:YD repeat-containing protein